MLIPRDKKSKKYVLKAIIAFLAGAGLFALKNVLKDENAADFVVILGAGSCILGVWFYYKSLRFSMESIVKPAFKKAFERIKKTVKNTVSKIKKKLGISENTWRMKGSDSFNFVFPSLSKKRGNKRDFGKARIKWNEDPGNPWKIRYIYTKYIVKRQKKGMYIKNSATALENGEKLTDCPYPEIFKLYTVSRYAPADISGASVSDETVEEAMEKLVK